MAHRTDICRGAATASATSTKVTKRVTWTMCVCSIMPLVCMAPGVPLGDAKTGHEPGVSTSTVDLADALLRDAVENRKAGRTNRVLTGAASRPSPAPWPRQACLHRR